MFEDGHAPITHLKVRGFEPRTDGQKALRRAIGMHDLSFGLGTFGTGKTFVPVAMAIEGVMRGSFLRAFFVRPAVESGEKLSSLPGDGGDKIAPFMQPLIDCGTDFIGAKTLRRLIGARQVECRPIAHTLRNDGNFKLHKAAGTYEPTFSEFGEAQSGRVTIQRKVLDGNPFIAAVLSAQRDIGSNTMITMEDGRTQSAVLIPLPKHNSMSSIPARTTDPEIAFDILREGGEIFTQASNRNEGMLIEADGPKLRITIPGKKSLAKRYQVPEFEEITGQLSGDWRGVRGWIDPDDILALTEVIRAQGMSLNFSGLCRDRVNEAALAKVEEAECSRSMAAA
ncbi:hypothetical protein AYJ57_21760 (plasmid) [Salipiger sp. CCB-MM3]|uniref:PhoH family protein n=1 Tax=Salipiger sp. CCB-MM3 TaxID=1792508 RepID=UPI00080ABE9B|nr:PhoH family protein [Salipiger sp. CCB-MM3]ANT63099.1 hypothetical protein AYJ57_21760 [Salipiger sp. CCB-MM3]